ncbi:MAG: TlpA family protein disulfide reductase [Actinomycetia bacterium]|nr:TlpA family protein disulfide reductase [Actinomycetes bacterium]
MANRQRAEARRKAQAKAARRGQSVDGGEGGSAGITINIWVIIVVVLALVTGGVIWAATSGDDKADSSDDTGVELVGLPDSQPVTVTGDALPTFDPDRTSNIAPVGELPDLGVGLPAPLLSGLDFQGDPITVDPAANGPYMLVFLAHWCPHCNAEVPRLLDWKGQGAVPSELTVLGIATAVSSSSVNYPPAEWFSNKGWSWPVMVDQSQGDGEAGVAASAYGSSGWPYFVIIGADGLVKARVSGEVAVADLQVIVNDALAG